MKLWTKSIRDKLIRNHTENEGQEETKKHKVVVKLFNPSGAGTWYLTELNPYTNVAFGLCEITEKELGYVDLTELEEYKGTFGLGIERDRYFKTNKTLEELNHEW